MVSCFFIVLINLNIQEIWFEEKCEIEFLNISLVIGCEVRIIFSRKAMLMNRGC